MHDEQKHISGSLRMREAEELAGRWRVDSDGQYCDINLGMERLDGANGWAVSDPTGCLRRIVPGAVAWRPVPEGLELAAADRRTLLVFTAIGAGTGGEATSPDGRRLRLRPA